MKKRKLIKIILWLGLNCESGCASYIALAEASKNWLNHMVGLHSDSTSSKFERSLSNSYGKNTQSTQRQQNLTEDNSSFQPTPRTTPIPTGTPTSRPTKHPSSPTDLPTMRPPSNVSSNSSNSIFGQTTKTTSHPSLQSRISLVPNLNSTAQPMFSPTANPTKLSGPTENPTRSPTIQKSLSANPHGLPKQSFYPIFSPTAKPSRYISLVPTPFPTTQTTLSPTENPTSSFGPTKTTTNLPSYAPSSIPHVLPTEVPTVAPSWTHSAGPSQSPTAFPSMKPSARPSNIPSEWSSTNPSTMPSQAPSSAPTPICHDNKAYRNPKNRLNRCANHNLGNGCFDYVFLGLSETEVIELIHNCPISCNYPCENFPVTLPTPAPSEPPPLQASLRFYLESVGGEMDDSALQEFENVTWEYFQTSILHAGARVFDGEGGVQLASQLLMPRRNLRVRSFENSGDRSLVADDILEVEIVLEIHTRLITKQNLVLQASSAIMRPEYTVALRSAHPFFAAARITQQFPTQKPSAISENSYENGREVSSKSVAVAAFISVLSTLAVTIVGFLLFSRRKSILNFRQNQVYYSSSLASECARDIESSAHEDNQPSGTSGDAEKQNVGQNSLNQGLVLHSTYTNKEADLNYKMAKTDLDIPSKPTKSGFQRLSPNFSAKREGQAKFKLSHGYEVPPMILIESLDDAFSDKDVSKFCRTTNEPGIMTILSEDKPNGNSSNQSQALIRFSRLLRHETSNLTSTSSLDKLDCMQKSLDFSPTNIKGNGTHDGSRNSHDESSSSQESAYSTPACNTTTESALVSHRRTLSAGDVYKDKDQPSEVLEILLREEWAKLVLNGTQEVNTKDTEDNYHRPPRQRNASFTTLSEGTGSYSEKASKRVRSLSDSERLLLYGRNLGDIDYDIEVCRHPDLLHSPTIGIHLADSPGQRSRIISHSSSLTASPGEFGGDIASKMSALHSSYARQDNPFDATEFQYTFDAPSRGKLGIIIESSEDFGPTIHTVKDYSPLFGMLQPGDKIVMVENYPTSRMGTVQITQLLAMTRDEKEDGMISITVVTPYEKAGIPCDLPTAKVADDGYVDKNGKSSSCGYFEQDRLGLNDASSSRNSSASSNKFDFGSFPSTFDEEKGRNKDGPTDIDDCATENGHSIGESSTRSQRSYAETDEDELHLLGALSEDLVIYDQDEAYF